MLSGFREKYLLSDNAYAGMRRGIFWTTATNLVTMGGIGFLFYAMDLAARAIFRDELLVRAADRIR